MSVDSILQNCNLENAICTPVHGGDINSCYSVRLRDKKYFLKVNRADQYPEMFKKEGNGLSRLAKASTLKIPAAIDSGQSGKEQFLLLEWLDTSTSRPGSWEQFGERLALLHKKPQPFFGLEEDNYIGNLPQLNKRCETWREFYSTQRIHPLIKRLFDEGTIPHSMIKAATAFGNKLPELFPQEPPALLHGDLWNGNFMFIPNGEVALYDPAVYYGHREMDIGMTKLFGGFDATFYQNYQATYPLENGWKERLDYSQLYPLLVHAVLFGGLYIQQSCRILERFL